MRSSWRLVLVVIVGSTIAAAQPAPAPAVPLLVIGAPSTFELARLASALDTYVPNAKLVVSASADAGCEEVLAAARVAQSPIGLWLHWTPEGAIVIERVGAAGCATIESSTVEVPPEQPSFVYRVIALKVASLVRELVPPIPVPPPPRIIATPPKPPSEPRSLRRAVDVGASGIADTAAESRGYFASAGAWFGDAWMLGGDVRVGLARDATGPGGHGSARAFGAFAGVRRAIVERRAWSIDMALELGAIGVRGAATRADMATLTTADVWAPAIALAPRIRFAVIGPLAIAVGPTLELLTRPVELDLGVSPLYASGRVRLRGDLQAEITF